MSYNLGSIFYGGGGCMILLLFTAVTGYVQKLPKNHLVFLYMVDETALANCLDFASYFDNAKCITLKKQDI